MPSRWRGRVALMPGRWRGSGGFDAEDCVEGAVSLAESAAFVA